MKKLIALTIFAGALLCSSCVKREMIPDEPRVVVKSSALKAVLPDGGLISFNSGDSLTAYLLKEKRFGPEKNTYITTGSGSFAEFQHKTGATPHPLSYAVYPCASDSVKNATVYLKLPVVQDAVKDGVDPKAALYVGKIINYETQLKSATAYVAFTIDQEKVVSCEISSTTECLAGNIKATVLDTLKMEVHNGWTKAVTVKGEFEKGAKYYAAICPSYNHTSFNIVLKNKDGMVMWDSAKGGDFKCSTGQIVDIGNVGNPDAATVNIKLKTSEYDGYKISSVIAYDAETMTKVYGGSTDATFTANQEQTLTFFGVNPADYSAKDLFYVISMSKGEDSVVLPLKLKGVNIGKGAEVTVQLGEISESRNGAPWYCPKQDRRLQCGDGYAFGEANTYLIQYKSSTYSKATLSPDPNIPEEVVIDYRVRGNFFSAPKPDNVTFEWKMGYTVASTSAAPVDADWGIYTGDRGKITNGRDFSFTQNADNYTVTVKNTGAHAQAPLLIMKDKISGEILWSWAFWNVAADGTRINETVDFGGAKLCKLDIGQASSQVETFTADSGCEIRRTCYYYQWGRSTPIFWQNTTRAFFGFQDANNAPGSRMAVYAAGPITVKEAIQHPGDVLLNSVTKGTANTTLNDWNAAPMTQNPDLWGGDKTAPKTTAGKKSIYDPCPKGWRVVDHKVFSQFETEAKGYTQEQFAQGKVKGYEGVYLADGLLFVCQGNLAAGVDASPSVKNNGFGIGGTCTSNNHWWTNAFISGTSAGSIQIDYFWTKCDMATVNANRTIKYSNRAIGTALPVRCQVDEQNR